MSAVDIQRDDQQPKPTNGKSVKFTIGHLTIGVPIFVIAGVGAILVPVYNAARAGGKASREVPAVRAQARENAANISHNKHDIQTIKQLHEAHTQAITDKLDLMQRLILDKLEDK